MARRFRLGIWLLCVAAGSTLIGGPAPLRGGQQLSLLFSTPLTGGQPVRMAVDSQGFIYLAGNTGGRNPPAGFVTKLTPSGAVLYTTFLQGSRFAGEPGDCLVDITGIAVDRNGTAYVTGCTSATDFPLVNAFRSTLQGSPTSGFVAKLSPGGTLLYSTFFGTGGRDTGTAIAADDEGNAYVVGSGNGPRLPLVNPAHRSGTGFAAKFNPSGSALLYSTYLGARPRAIAVDRFRSAYIAGSATTALPAVRPIQPCRDDDGVGGEAFVIKLNPSGSSFDYATCLGGTRSDEATGIAVDASGSAYVVGTTRSLDFPMVRPLDVPPRTGPLWKTDDGGRTWNNLALDMFSVNTLLPSPIDALTWYAGGEGGFKTTDGGAQWRRLGLPRGEFGSHPAVYRIAIDRRQPSVLYAATSAGLFKSVDNGDRWTEIGAALPFNGAFLRGVDVDPFDSQLVYAASQRGFWKSVDGGTTWRTSHQGLPSNQGLGGDPFVATLLVERSTGALYADIFVAERTRTSHRLFKSTDRGATWMSTTLEIPERFVTGLAATPGRRRRIPPRERSRGDTRSEVEPGTVYVAAQQVLSEGPFGLLLRSDDGGHTWQSIGRELPRFGPSALVVVPGNPEHVYAASRGVLFVSDDRGETFEPVPDAPSFESINSLAVDPARAATLLVAVSPVSDAFVARIRPGGTALEYSTYLGGAAEDVSLGVAVDDLGRATVFGSTRSSDFPAVAPFQEPSDDGDGFLSIVDGGGGVLLFSTWVGGPGTDSVASVARSGSRIFIAGGSTDLAGMFPGTAASGAGAFVARVDR